LFGAIGGFIVFLLKAIPSVCGVGDWLRWIFTISPVFSVVYSIVWSTSSALITGARNSGNPAFAKCGVVPTNNFAFENLGGDSFMLCVNATLGLIILVLIELRLCESCRKKTFSAIPEAKTLAELD